MEQVDSGSTTRRATVHSLRSGLKIESPKAREGPRVIIFRPWLENHGGSVATAIVQLLQRTKPGTKPVPQCALKKDLEIRVKHLHSAGRLTAQNSSARSAFCGLRFVSHAHFALQIEK